MSGMWSTTSHRDGVLRPGSDSGCRLRAVGWCGEARSAAAHRRRRITSTTLRRAVDRIDEPCTELDVIGLDPDLAHSAGDLAEAHGLRGHDAVHLATALSVESDSMLLATWDGDLARAAVAAGCSVSPPPALR